MITFRVYGKPEPGGSKRAFAIRDGKGNFVMRADGSPVINVTDDNPKVKEWRRLVAFEAKRAMAGAAQISGPVYVQLSFYVARIKGHFGTGRNAKTLKESAPAWPIGKPDVLKLARAVEDAMTGIVWIDDAQIVREVLSKEYGEQPGVDVRISRILNPQAIRRDA